MTPGFAPPSSRQALWERARQLAGLTVEQIANRLHMPIPDNLNREKGWVGQLLEMALGCDAGSKPMPDFPHLGIELKTLPLNAQHKVKESTYVCVVPLRHLTGLRFENSLLWDKLSTVLWFPIEFHPDSALKDQLVLSPLLWSPDPQQKQYLEHDFNEHMERIALGEINDITARDGNVIQIRPKAANASQLTTAIGPEGTRIQTLPRGFYLRPHFTQDIINRYYQ